MAGATAAPSVTAELARALIAGRQGGKEAAEALINVVGQSADLSLVVESLQAATAALAEAAKKQVLSDNPLPPPPDVAMHYGGRTELDITHLLLESIAKLECTKAKLALARTCKAWHRALWHPAFWTTYQLPHFSSNSTMKRFLERQTQRFQRTTCFWVSRPTNAVSMNEASVLLLFQIAPALTELVVYSSEPALGDSFVKLLDRAAFQDHKPFLRLKRFTLRRVWISSKIFSCWVRKVRLTTGAAPDDSEDEVAEGGGGGDQTAFRAEPWAASLEEITFFNLPPARQTRETADKIIYSPKPLDESTCELMQGLGALSSMRLHNPVTGATCVLDVEGGRAGLEPFDRRAYHAYARGLPAPARVPADTRRNRPFFFHGGHIDHRRRVGENDHYIFEPPPAAAAEAGPSSSSGASTSAAPGLQPPEAKAARGRRAGPSLQGRRMLVPHSIWPDYSCSENDGAGWAAIIMSVCSGGIVRVHFKSATDEEGLPYPDELLRVEDLRPL